MHLAKGLEFRAVAVMACDDEIIPLQERIETVGDDAELHAHGAWGLREVKSSSGRRTRRSRAPSNGPEAFFVAQFSAGYTTNMFGFDLRTGTPVSGCRLNRSTQHRR
jgi:superfamily I DNA/RNA helicase